MKFLTFGDTHEDQKQLKELLARATQDDIDFLVCVGDISTFGRGIHPTLKRLNSLNKKTYIIPGNHEEGGTKFVDALKKYPNCISIHEQAIEIKNYVFLGYGGGGFALEDPNFRNIARKWYGKYKGKKIVFVTHQAPFGCKLDLLGERHVGNKDYQNFVRRINPTVAISGHLHETVGIVQKIGPTTLMNPGWEGKVVELP